MPLLRPSGNLATPYTESIDKAIVKAAAQYMEVAQLSWEDVATGFSELSKLRYGPSEPDYNMPGIAIAYAFKYFAIRVSGVLTALNFVRDVRHHLNVLDLGSGSGAGRLAIELLGPIAGLAITSIEMSAGMSMFADCLPPFASVKRDLRVGSLYRPPIREKEQFDLVLLSACLPYNGAAKNEWTSLAQILAGLTHERSSVIIIEPDAKRQIAFGIAAALRTTRAFFTSTLPPALGSANRLPLSENLLNEIHSKIIDLPELTANGRRFIGKPAWPVENWNAPDHPDTIIVAYRQ